MDYTERLIRDLDESILAGQLEDAFALIHSAIYEDYRRHVLASNGDVERRFLLRRLRKHRAMVSELEGVLGVRK